MFLPELDVHTHTISSGHYTTDTITDMVKQAKLKNLKLLGISEHGPALSPACTPSYFRNLALAPSSRMGIHVLYGVEVNILSNDGLLDLDDEIMSKLDYCIAGMHLPCHKPGTVQENTAAYIAAMENPYVKILAHPDDVKYPVDYEQLVQAAMDCHVLLEINNSSLMPGGYRGNTTKNNRTVLDLCKKYRYPVLLSSDSHGHAHVGDFTYAMELIKRMSFPLELVINYPAEDFLKFFNLSS